MRKIKFIIPLLILFLTIGFAAVNFSLSINGDTEITGNLDNFNVYFSRALVNGETNNSVVSSKTQLDFSGIIDKVGNTYTIEYDVTNASTLFDAEVTVKCTPSSEYLLVQNTFNVSSNLSALETRTGTLLLKKLKTISNDSSIYKTITCEIVATPVERESEVTGTIAEPLNPTYIGREIAIGEEKFNVISSTEDTVTMLAKKTLNSEYRQSDSYDYLAFSTNPDWTYESPYVDLNIQDYPGPAQTYTSAYLTYIKELTGDNSITVDLITYNDLSRLGCVIEEFTCETSIYKSWLIIEPLWWTKTAISETDVAFMYGSLISSAPWYDNSFGIRPTITISRELYTKLISSSSITYNVGREISIGDEKFNVISDNGLTVTMLAQYNIGTDNRQSTISQHFMLSLNREWELESNSNEIVLESIDDGEVVTYINEYVEYLSQEINDYTLKGDLITLKELQELGCIIEIDNSWTGNEECSSSPYNSWLINGQDSWTRTVYENAYVWTFSEENLSYMDGEYTRSIRPTITISKETLNYLESLGNYEIGEEISIEEENFNVISQTATTVTMLAQYNLGADFKQTANEHYVTFSDGNGWEYTPAPKEIDIDIWSSNPKNYVKGYVSYLENITKDSNINGNLLTLSELKELGCVIPSSYAHVSDEDTSDRTCKNSQYVSWLNNGHSWWLRSAYAWNDEGVWRMHKDGDLYGNNFANSYGIRPTITISKETLKYLASQKKYEVGQEVSIGDEKFNVISDNGTTISMLAQYNLGADYRQTSTDTYTTFSNSNGWSYNPGPKEIDIQAYDGETLTYIKNYKTYLNTIIKDQNLKVDLITLRDLEQLGCKIQSDYSYTGSETCIGSTNSSWLINGQRWWTRSAVPDHSQRVWRVLKDGDFGYNVYPTSGVNGVRPVITIAKSAL